jgi:hypothetical protein
MAQAEAIPTTRRAFSKWLAAASVAAAVPMPAIAAPVSTTDWVQIELELGGAWAHVAYFDEEIALCQKASDQWKRRNPWPDEPDYSSHTQRIADHKNQIARESKWVERYQNMLRQTGKGKLGRERLVAYQQYVTECERVVKIPVLSLADIKAKTRVARFERPGGLIHRAIAKDIQNI